MVHHIFIGTTGICLVSGPMSMKSERVTVLTTSTILQYITSELNTRSKYTDGTDHKTDWVTGIPSYM
jgi:hypothetical protein